jgi:hypothetical protein
LESFRRDLFATDKRIPFRISKNRKEFGMTIVSHLQTKGRRKEIITENGHGKTIIE